MLIRIIATYAYFSRKKKRILLPFLLICKGVWRFFIIQIFKNRCHILRYGHIRLILAIAKLSWKFILSENSYTRKHINILLSLNFPLLFFLLFFFSFLFFTVRAQVRLWYGRKRPFLVSTY